MTATDSSIAAGTVSPRSHAAVCPGPGRGAPPPPLPQVPPGNADPQQRALWEGVAATSAASGDESGPALDVSHMSPAERAAYEEKRTKMRKVGVGFEDEGVRARVDKLVGRQGSGAARH